MIRYEDYSFIEIQGKNVFFHEFFSDALQKPITALELIDRAFRGADMVDSTGVIVANTSARNTKLLSSNNLQLGWNSVVTFTRKADATLEIHNIVGKGKLGDLLKKVSQIVTRGTHSCTFLYLTNDVDCLMAHLDVNGLKPAVGTIEAFLAGKTNVTMYASIIKDGQEEEAFFEQVKSRDEITQVKLFKRKSNLTLKSLRPDLAIPLELESHIEIGVDVSGNVFGDLTNSKTVGEQLMLFEDSSIFDETAMPTPKVVQIQKYKAKHGYVIG